MLASPAESLPSGPDWVHEVKWDGMRIMAAVGPSGVRLTSRTERDVTAAFPELAGIAAEYPDTTLDGEVVALRDAVPSFAALTERIHVTSASRAARLAAAQPVTYLVFDVVRLLGQDLTGQPWSARRELLEKLDLASARWQVPAIFDDGPELLAATQARGLEGVVSKRRSSRYTPGRRSPDWLKRPHRPTISVAVGGWRPEEGSPGRLGAVLAGVPDGRGGWRYVGRVGSGLAGATGATVLGRLQRVPEAPFSNRVPAEDAATARWTEPRVLLDVQSLGIGAGGKLRAPSVVRLRSDVEASDLNANDLNANDLDADESDADDLKSDDAGGT